ncbi:hypothetical protein K490DRAFT_69437 [Saccharata proteae CBS 121410]|uniref:Uncharacterized protein n=1 Tax=Saccharata proteae CBS 121410 TaxID=1314787 RepID=A0A9P4LU62_9PEZI|nr:hypothetical protein K490DRAFT_69437 [Saccharata proteae CBS 121410]
MWFHKHSKNNCLDPTLVRWKVHPSLAASASHLEFIRVITRRATVPKVHMAAIETSDCNCATARPGCTIHYVELSLEEWNDLMRWHARSKVPIVPAGVCHCRRLSGSGHLSGMGKRGKELDVLDWYYPQAAGCGAGDGEDVKKMLTEAMEGFKKDEFVPVRQISGCFEDSEEDRQQKGLKGHLGMFRRHTR